MYEPSNNARVVPIEPPLPTADIGAPMPSVAATEAGVVVAYRTSLRDGPIQIAVAQFAPGEFYFGAPSDEAFHGHPLYSVGLKHYEFAEVINSPWIAALERMNRAHPRHDPSRFETLRHFVLPFHDSTFECVARTVQASVTEAPDPTSALESMFRERQLG